MVAVNWRVLWGKNRLARAALVLGGVVIVWPWLATTALMVASLGLPPDVVQKAWALPVWTSLAMPLAVVALLVCGFNEFIGASFDNERHSRSDRTGLPTA